MKRFVIGLGAIVCVGVIVVACGGETTFACGTVTCSGDEVCVHPCCGGAPPQCVEADDAGVCPQGTSMATSFQQCTSSSSTTPCVPDPCTPPPPYCAPKGGTCQGNQQDSENCYQGCA